CAYLQEREEKFPIQLIHRKLFISACKGIKISRSYTQLYLIGITVTDFLQHGGSTSMKPP
ncbi:hypothetical protein, partial [uncultured Muribaculum sp.]|uniref:hypothetical protein n=1 Tax=uncultured Muribaculum sp. TaxID=1918613 RepID=UPI002610FEA0